MNDGGYVYIVSNQYRTVLYIGVTSDIRQRIYEHKEGKGSKFTSKYKCHDLIYYEWIPDISFAIEREKQLKNWHRDWKFNLVKSVNPKMIDLYDELW
ncbi:MAG TPA: GIY-YIG nuclease family protein [Sphingobacteriaceae bacterium]